MIVGAFVLLALGWLFTYCGFTNTSVRDEIASALNGQNASANSSGSSGGSSSPGGTNVSTGSSSFARTGKMTVLPAQYCQVSGIQVDSGIAEAVIALCEDFNVKVSSGKRASAGDHSCGAACDFVGTRKNMKALWKFANSSGRYAYVEPWASSTTIGVLGTTGPHVHISFFRCG